jgi:AraC-like DNA-binding protein
LFARRFTFFGIWNKIYFMTSPDWQFRVRLRSYTFYDQREQFVNTRSIFGEWVLIGVEAGAFDYDTGTEKGQVQPGEVLLCTPHQVLWRSAIATPFTYHVLQWSFLEGSALWTAGKWPVRDTARLRANYALLRSLYGLMDDFTRRRLENLLEDILLLTGEARHTPAGINDPTMRDAAHMLSQRAGDVFSMAEISDAVGLKPVQFTRRFRRAHGLTPIEYLTKMRLEIARRLLIETDASLDEIAERCGWSSGYYLSNVFKNAFGLAPGQFRRLHRV